MLQLGMVRISRFLVRFEAKFKKSEFGCWEWIRYTGKGRPCFDGHVAARVAYELYVGPIPDGLYVCHTCDNGRCVNPDHLWVGTQLDNMHDCVRKLRMHQGENSPHAKLKEFQIRELGKLYETGRWTQQQLADRFGVSRWTISDIIRGRRWQHLRLKVVPGRDRRSFGDANGARLHRDRLVRGESHPRTLIMDVQVEELRRLSYRTSQRRLAMMFGISQTQVGRILRGESRVPL